MENITFYVRIFYKAYLQNVCQFSFIKFYTGARLVLLPGSTICQTPLWCTERCWMWTTGDYSLLNFYRVPTTFESQIQGVFIDFSGDFQGPSKAPSLVYRTAI